MRRRSRAGSVKSRRRKPAAPKRPRGNEAARPRSSSAVSQESEIARLGRELAEARQEQKATAEVLGVISSFPGKLEPVFQAMLESATRLCEAKFGTMFRFDGKLFHLAAQFGTPSELIRFQRERGPFEPAGSGFRRLMRSKELAHIIDAAAEDAASPAVRYGGARSVVHVPMLNGDALVGALIIYRREVRPFTDKQIALLTNFAAQAVIAIENTRLLSELRQRTADLSESLEQQTATSDVLKIISSSPGELEAVFQAMLENAVRICEAKFAHLQLYEDGSFRIGAMHNTPAAFAEVRERQPVIHPSPESPLGRVAATKQVLHIIDYAEESVYKQRDPSAVRLVDLAGARTLLVVPMLNDDTLIGTISIFRQEVRPFNDKQITLLQNFAAQAVIAIENARLLSELRQSLEQQTATADVLKIISTSPGELEPVFDTILENATRICEARFGILLLFDGKDMRVVAMHNTPREHEELRRRDPIIPLERSIVRPLVRTKELSLVADITAEEPYASSPLAKASGARTAMAVPMLREEQLIGAITIYRQEVRPFTDKQIDLVKNFAAQAVIAIENARLLKELRERTEQLEVRSQEIAKLNKQLAQRVTDQVGEIERMGRLRRFLPPQVADLIVASGTEKQLESHRREITALFCDLRGFTGFSESSDPEDVMALLRDYHTAIGQIIIKYSGTLERFAGDGVMVIFNDPVPVENPALQAVLMALEMRTAIGAMIEKWRLLGHDLGFGIGIAHGFATLGTIGFEGRFDYAAIGTVSNVASRLCDEAKPGQILVSPRVRQAVEKAVTVESVGEFTLKGIRRPMAAYNVLESSPSKSN